METKEQDQRDWQSGQQGEDTPEALALRELFSYWSNLLWKESMRPLIQHLFQIDLTMSESQILRYLDTREQPRTISEVADYLAITHSAASRVVDRLVDDAFISRTENPADRRQKQLQLTGKGKAIVGMLNTIFSSGIERLVARLPEHEQAQFHQLIAHMIAAVTKNVGAE